MGFVEKDWILGKVIASAMTFEGVIRTLEGYSSLGEGHPSLDVASSV